MNAYDEPAGRADDEAELVEAVLSHYRARLRETPVAMAWLVEHGIVGGDAVDAFGVGFADRSLGLSLPSGVVGRRLRDRLKALGVLRASGHEQFRGCVLLPIRDRAGRAVQCYGRRVERPKARSGTVPPGAVWLPAPATGIWHPEALASGEVIVADSALDGLAWWSAGYRHVIAAGGPAGLPEQVGRLLEGAGVTRLLLAQARTTDGEHAAAALTERLAPAKVECFRVLFPYGGDASMLTLDAGHAAEALGERLRAAVWLGRGGAPSRPHRAAGGRTRIAVPPGVGVAPPAISPVVGSDASRADVAAADGAGLVASPVPAPALAACDVTVDGGELTVTTVGLAWRVRGLERVTGPSSLRVTVSVRDVDTDAFHLDVVDLFCARARDQFLRAVESELGVRDTERLRRDMGRVLLACEDRVLDLQQQARQPDAVATVMTVADEQAALELLRDPRLLERVVDDVAALGVVGERDNVLLAYLAATSRLLDTPLAVVIQSGSGAGKSTLTDAVLSLIPAESRLSVSAITGQSLFYLGEGALAHKVLSVAEAVGAQRAGYPLRLLTGDGELSIASTGKDPATGALVTRTYRVRGPVALFLSTTATSLDDELADRAVVIGVGNDPAQTRAILAAQRHAHTLDGLLAHHDRQRLRELHTNAQRLLEPVAVVIPIAPHLTFADRRTRARRDQAKLLTLIRAVTLLHQHQRPRRRITRHGLETVFIEATAEDVAVAQRLAAGLSGRPDLADVAPQTRRLLELLDALVAAEARAQQCRRENVRFTRRRAREYVGWSDYALRRHLARLVELEFLAPHRSGNAYIYELLWSEQDDVSDGESREISDHHTGFDALAGASRGDLAGGSRSCQGRS